MVSMLHETSIHSADAAFTSPQSLLIRMQSVTLGAITQLYAGTAPEAKDLGGKVKFPIQFATVI